jgi:hypothetical protein
VLALVLGLKLFTSERSHQPLYRTPASWRSRLKTINRRGLSNLVRTGLIRPLGAMLFHRRLFDRESVGCSR